MQAEQRCATDDVDFIYVVSNGGDFHTTTVPKHSDVTQNLSIARLCILALRLSGSYPELDDPSSDESS